MDVEVKQKNKKEPHFTDAQVKELIAKSQNGDHEARDAIVNRNTRLVWSVVQRFMNRGYEADDLFQIGCIGLIKSVDKFDLSYDVKFSTYAVPMIIGEIQRFLRDDGTVKVSRSIKELGNKIRKAKQVLEQQGDTLLEHPFTMLGSTYDTVPNLLSFLAFHEGVHFSTAKLMLKLTKHAK